jgi:hypothetical protein
LLKPLGKNAGEIGPLLEGQVFLKKILILLKKFVPAAKIGIELLGGKQLKGIINKRISPDQAIPLVGAAGNKNRLVRRQMSRLYNSWRG